MVKKTVRTYYIFIALFQLGISFISAMYVVFLMSHGLNLLQVNLVNFAFFTTLLLFEVPTGIIADTFGRKTSYVLACFTMSLSMFLYGASSSLSGFIFAEIVGAIGATLASGAFQAWFVDRIRFFGYEGELDHFFAREQFFKQSAVIVGALAGAILADINLAIPWYLGGIVFMGIGVGAITALNEEYFVRTKLSFTGSLRMMQATLQSSMKFGLEQRSMRFILLMGLVQYVALQAPNMQWQPFFSQFLDSKSNLGFIFTGISFSIALGALFSKRIGDHIRNRHRSLFVAQIFIALGIIGTVLVTGFPMILLMFLGHEFARGVYRPLKDAFLNNNIPSAQRATLLSFESMMTHAGGMIGLLISGYLAQSQSIPFAWVASGGLMIAGTMLVMWRR